jgi:flagellar basal-body rod protein FlgF
MDALLTAAASGMKARMESLDMLANNIANVDTAGFKADREFYNLYQQELPLVENRWTDFAQGSVVPTGNQLDLALSGKGFFALNGPNGTVYTRNGSFQIGKQNQLVSAEGYTLRNAADQGKPMTVNPQVAISVDRQGVVTQQGQMIGRLQLDPMPTQGIDVSKLGSSYFALLPPSGAAGSVNGTEVLQGHLEQSNVPVADSTVRLMNVMRQFEMLQRALTLGAQMNKQAIEQVARV